MRSPELSNLPSFDNRSLSDDGRTVDRFHDKFRNYRIILFKLDIVKTTQVDTSMHTHTHKIKWNGKLKRNNTNKTRVLAHAIVGQITNLNGRKFELSDVFPQNRISGYPCIIIYSNGTLSNSYRWRAPVTFSTRDHRSHSADTGDPARTYKANIFAIFAEEFDVNPISVLFNRPGIDDKVYYNIHIQ